MQKQIQFILTTPEELAESIAAAMDSKFQDLKKSLPRTIPEEYFTREETAQLLKKDLSTIYHWTKKGTLIAFYIEGSVFYKRSQIESVMVSITTASK